MAGRGLWFWHLCSPGPLSGGAGRAARRAEPGSARREPAGQGRAVIRALEPTDWPAVKAIFEEGIATGQATFETKAPSWDHWDGAHFGGLIAVEGDEVVGWTALTPYSSRPCYDGVAEESVYVSARARGRGVGRALLDTLIDESERNGIWTRLAGVVPENRASVSLPLGCGFRTVGLHTRIGLRNGDWRDVLLLERRSEVIR